MPLDNHGFLSQPRILWHNQKSTTQPRIRRCPWHNHESHNTTGTIPQHNYESHDTITSPTTWLQIPCYTLESHNTSTYSMAQPWIPRKQPQTPWHYHEFNNATVNPTTQSQIPWHYHESNNTTINLTNSYHESRASYIHHTSFFRCSPRGFSATCLQQMQGSVVEGLSQTAASGSQCFFVWDIKLCPQLTVHNTGISLLLSTVCGFF